MDRVAALSNLAHVAIAFALVAGVIGRNLAYGEARRASDLRVIAALTGLARRSDRLLVIPGSGLVLLSGIVTAWVEQLPLLGFLQGAHSNWLLASIVLYLAIGAIVGLGFVPRRRALDRELERAMDQGQATPELVVTLNSTAFLWARRAELSLLAAIGVLMVLKPF